MAKHKISYGKAVKDTYHIERIISINFFGTSEKINWMIDKWSRDDDDIVENIGSLQSNKALKN